MRTISSTKELQKIVFKIENFKLNDNESLIILDYLEGHDYEIKTDEKELFIADVLNQDDIIKEDIRDIINRVIEWNESLKDDVIWYIEYMFSIYDKDEYMKLNEKLNKLKEDENKLDKLISAFIQHQNYSIYK